MNDNPEIVRPARPLRQRLSFLVRTVVSILGVLFMGAGVCCGVFCGIAFNEADRSHRQLEQFTGQAAKLAKAAPNSTIPYGGVELNQTAWQEMVRQEQVTFAWKAVHAFILLSVSIGLFLGGTSLALLGWALRPRIVVRG